MHLPVRLPSYRGKPFAIDGVALLLHVGYLTEIFHRPWVLPAFWTLALEFQYYLLMALCYPLVHHRNAAVRLLTIGGWALVSLLPVGREWVPGWGAWFALGILAHTYRAGRLNRWSFVAAVVACGVIVGIHGIPVQGVVTAIVALVIGFVTLERPRLVFLGTLSYSLYLVHEPVGGRVVNLATHFDGRPAWLNVCVVAAALGASLTAAGLLHRFVEGPSQRLSSRIRFARRAA